MASNFLFQEAVTTLSATHKFYRKPLDSNASKESWVTT